MNIVQYDMECVNKHKQKTGAQTEKSKSVKAAKEKETRKHCTMCTNKMCLFYHLLLQHSIFIPYTGNNRKRE